MQKEINIEYVPISSLRASEFNPRIWSKEQRGHLKESISRFGVVDALVANRAPGRENIVIGGNFRLEILKELGHKTVPVVFVSIPYIEKEKELNLRLNKNLGEFNLEMLSGLDGFFLSDIGFSSEELDEIFFDEEDKKEEMFDLEKALKKIGIESITVQKGDVYDLDGSRLMCGDSTIENDVLSLMDNHKADMVLTDPPYILDYLHGKSRQGKATVGFGIKKNRRYLETEFLPDNFSELWMANAAKVQAKDFSIICYENWKNTRVIWNEMEKHWKIRNMLIWHTPNRNQGYSGKHKFFSKYDIALVGTTDVKKSVNLEKEDLLLENEYQTALFAVSGNPHWESYGKDKKYCPTDFIKHNTADKQSSGQEVVFGVKPVEILIPYIKILTKRGQLVFEPFGGSGSTLIASSKIGRKCFLMEKSPVYAEVILNRWEKFTGKKRKKLNVRQQ